MNRLHTKQLISEAGAAFPSVTDPAELKDVHFTVIAGRMRAMRLLPLWGHLLINFKLVPKPDIEWWGGNPTMAVDQSSNIFYYPGFVKSLTGEEVTGVLCHEAGHVVFLSLFRKGNRDHQLWNVATDFIINRILKQDGITLPKQGCLTDDNFCISDPEFVEAYGKPLDIKEMNAEDLYEILRLLPKFNPAKFKWDTHIYGTIKEEDAGGSGGDIGREDFAVGDRVRNKITGEQGVVTKVTADDVVVDIKATLESFSGLKFDRLVEAVAKIDKPTNATWKKKDTQLMIQVVMSKGGGGGGGSMPPPNKSNSQADKGSGKDAEKSGGKPGGGGGGGSNAPGIDISQNVNKQAVNTSNPTASAGTIGGSVVKAGIDNVDDSPETAANNEQQTRQVVAQAMSRNKQDVTFSGGSQATQRELKELFASKTNWVEILRKYFKSLDAKARYDFSRMSKRGAAIGSWGIPKMSMEQGNGGIDCLIAIDSSGSTWDDYPLFISECLKLMKTVPAVKADVVYWTDKITQKPISVTTKNYKKLMDPLQEAGGTSMDCVAEFIEAYPAYKRNPPKLVIYFTDWDGASTSTGKVAKKAVNICCLTPRTPAEWVKKMQEVCDVVVKIKDLNKESYSMKTNKKLLEAKAPAAAKMSDDIDPTQMNDEDKIAYLRRGELKRGQGGYSQIAQKIPFKYNTKESSNNVINIKSEEFMYSIVRAYYSRNTRGDLIKKPLLVYGKPGIGKSTLAAKVARAIAHGWKAPSGEGIPTRARRQYVQWSDLRRSSEAEKSFNLPGDKSSPRISDVIANPEKYFVYIDIRASGFEPTDFLGLPDVKGNAQYLEYKTKEVIHFLTLPQADGIIMLDEINLSHQQTLNALMGLLQERIIGGVRISKDILVIAAGNPLTDEEGVPVEYVNVNPLTGPVVNRFKMFNMEVDPEGWFKFAYKARLPDPVIAFVRSDLPDNLWKAPSGATKTDQPFPSPRSITDFAYEFKNIYEQYQKEFEAGRGNTKGFYDAIYQEAGGACGQEWALKFMAFLEDMNLFNMDYLIKNREKIDKLTKQKQWAVLATLNGHIYRILTTDPELKNGENRIYFDTAVNVLLHTQDQELLGMFLTFLKSRSGTVDLWKRNLIALVELVDKSHIKNKERFVEKLKETQNLLIRSTQK